MAPITAPAESQRTGAQHHRYGADVIFSQCSLGSCKTPLSAFAFSCGVPGLLRRRVLSAARHHPGAKCLGIAVHPLTLRSPPRLRRRAGITPIAHTPPPFQLVHHSPIWRTTNAVCGVDRPVMRQNIHTHAGVAGDDRQTTLRSVSNSMSALPECRRVTHVDLVVQTSPLLLPAPANGVDPM